MSLLDRFRRTPPNPTADWVRDSWPRLTLDLDRTRIGGAGLGDPLAKLSYLGPAERLRDLGSFYSFQRDGVVVEEEGGVIVWFAVVLGPGGWLEAQPYAGTIQWRGEVHSADVLAGEPAVTSLLGAPYWRDQDEDEVLLFYEAEEGIEWQIEIGLDGRCRLLSAGEPLLDGEEQRRAYGVTKPWPPPTWLVGQC